MVEVNTADSARPISDRFAKNLAVIDFIPRNFGVLPLRERDPTLGVIAPAST
jgi:hypothetical protein